MESTASWSTRNRLAGSLVGMLVGDALGVPYEFHAPQAIPALDMIAFEPPTGFARAHAGATTARRHWFFWTAFLSGKASISGTLPLAQSVGQR